MLFALQAKKENNKDVSEQLERTLKIAMDAKNAVLRGEIRLLNSLMQAANQTVRKGMFDKEGQYLVTCVHQPSIGLHRVCHGNMVSALCLQQPGQLLPIRPTVRIPFVVASRLCIQISLCSVYSVPHKRVSFDIASSCVCKMISHAVIKC